MVANKGQIVAGNVQETLIGAVPFSYQVIEGETVRQVEGGVIDEQLLSIYVNGQSLATMMCSPLQLEALAVGFMYNEGVIESAAEIGLLQLNLPNSVADVILKHDEVKLPRRMILTTGCGGGMTGQVLSSNFPAIGKRIQYIDRDYQALDARAARRGEAIQCRAWCAYGGAG